MTKKQEAIVALVRDKAGKKSRGPILSITELTKTTEPPK